VAVYATGVNHRTTTPDNDRSTAAEWVGLRQSVRRLAAGQGVMRLLHVRCTGKSPGMTRDCASLRSPVSVQRQGAHKDGRGLLQQNVGPHDCCVMHPA
jgi:hypothetical protein